MQEDDHFILVREVFSFDILQNNGTTCGASCKRGEILWTKLLDVNVI